MILKIWDDRPCGEGWIFIDHIKALKNERNKRWCIAKNISDDPLVHGSCGIFATKDDQEKETLIVDRTHSFHPANGAFGSWMFSGTRMVELFKEEDFTFVRIITVVFESEEEQSFILKINHPDIYLLSDIGKTIERI